MQTTLSKLAVIWPLAIFLSLPAMTRGETAVQAWVQSYNGPGNSPDYAIAVAVDGDNNVIVTGQSPGIGSEADYATIRYSSAGVPLWTNRYNGPGNTHDAPAHLAVDSSNNVIVTGISEADFLTIKYSSDGAALWTNRYNGPGNGYDDAYGVAVDSNNNVIVTGYSEGSGGDVDYATIKYSSAGGPLWTNRYNGQAFGYFDPAHVVAVDSSNNVIVAVQTLGTGGSQDSGWIKYSSAGVPLRTNYYSGLGNLMDLHQDIVVDGSNNVIVVVNSFDAGGHQDEDSTTIKYSSTGVPLWVKHNAPEQSYADAMAVDRNGNVIVTGYSTSSVSYNDFATIKYVCVPEPVLTGLELTNGTFQMRVEDVLQPGTLVIEAATNLTGWEPVFTNTTPTNMLFYTDPEAGDYPQRFYRAFQFP